MAIAYCHVGIMTRGKGKSAVAAAAYRAREKLHNEREGTTYEYSRKGGLVHSEILAPEHAPEWVYEREKLWNEVERIEKQRNAQLAREVVVALPHELTHTQNIALARDYAQTFVQEGMVADLAVHDSGDGNPHAHLLLTMRAFEQDGTWAAKSRKDYILDEQGEKIRLASGEYKSKKVDSVDWNSPDKVEVWRAYYEQVANRHLELAGQAERIDTRSYERQGLDREGTVHLGHYAHQLEQQGEHSVRGDINRQIEARNREREELHHQQAQLEKALAKEMVRVEAVRQQERRREQEAAATIQREQMARERAAAKQQAEALRREKTISEEAARRRVAEWERQAQQALEEEQARQAGLTPEQIRQEESRWEAMLQEAAGREADARRKDAEREAIEREAAKERLQQAEILRRRQEAYSRYKRTFLRPHRLTRPNRPLEPPPKVDVREEAQKQERQREEQTQRWQELKWQLQDEKQERTLERLAREQAIRREHLLQRLAEEQPGRAHWQNVQRQQAAQRINWAKEKERLERQRPSWAKATEREREQEREQTHKRWAEREQRQPVEQELHEREEKREREQEQSAQHDRHKPLTASEREQTVSYDDLYRDDARDYTKSKQREPTRDEPELDL